ncbi:chaperonin 10-like protein [Fusarium avenaceum]|nr:chaperonin 10-like protein [Fusarium avenaceum]
MSLPNTTRRWVLTSLEGPDALKLESVELSPPGPNEIVVKMAAWSLNYRDLVQTQGYYPSPLPLPFVPISDGAGLVVATGEKVKRLRPGDKVFTIFKSNWVSGRLKDEDEASSIASPDVPGVLAEYVVLGENFWSLMPETLTYLEASTLPIAGVTAWNALYGSIESRLLPGQSVLTEGTGGFAKAGGAKVIATTSSAKKAETLKSLGVDHIINYNDVPEWVDEVKIATKNKGVDLVVEVGGGNTMRKAMKSVKTDGSIAIVGFVSAFRDPQPTALEMFFSKASFRTIHCGSVEHLNQMCAAIEQYGIKPYIGKVFKFEDVIKAYKCMSEEDFTGKICISME